MNRGPIAVAITGASGSAYALRLIECLIEAGETLYLMVSQAGQIVLNMESDLDLPSQPAEMQKILTRRFQAKPGQLQVFG
ncbi:MAG: aromatic acid decarboxylase, partial [Candidatus Thiodiazotropha sp. (ex Lucinoma borealis)]|nr:aromatic acid decarboxylase [Candidatus Thiodiazotropha sp. (ex Lucinoma borealis)]